MTSKNQTNLKLCLDLCKGLCSKRSLVAFQAMKEIYVTTWSPDYNWKKVRFPQITRLAYNAMVGKSGDYNISNTITMHSMLLDPSSMDSIKGNLKFSRHSISILFFLQAREILKEQIHFNLHLSIHLVFTGQLNTFGRRIQMCKSRPQHSWKSATFSPNKVRNI